MKIQEQNEYFQTELTRWLASESGSSYALDESVLWDELNNGVPATHILQLGQIGIETLDGEAQKPLVFDAQGCSGMHIAGVAEYLPFKDDTFDSVLLPHTLEAVANPYQALREAHRVLRPGGFLMLTGFNPRSLFGLLGRWYDEGKVIHDSIRWIDVSRVIDWLELLGYEVHDVHYQNYNPIQKIRFFLNHQLPAMGNLYGIRARKNVHSMTLNTERSKLWQLNNPVKALSVRQYLWSRDD